MLLASAVSDFRDLSDEQLVALARAEDEEAFACLVSRYSAMLHRLSSRYSGTSPLEAEDLAQEGLLGLLSAVRTFIPNNGTAFGTYAHVCMRNRMLSAVRRSQGEPPLVNDSDEPAAEAVAVNDPAALLVRREELESLRGHIRSVLTELEYRVLMRYLGAYSYEEIASSLANRRKAVDNALQRLRRKLAVSFPSSRR